jgi:hypothetical protein
MARYNSVSHSVCSCLQLFAVVCSCLQLFAVVCSCLQLFAVVCSCLQLFAARIVVFSPILLVLVKCIPIDASSRMNAVLILCCIHVVFILVALSFTIHNSIHTPQLTPHTSQFTIVQIRYFQKMARSFGRCKSCRRKIYKIYHQIKW